MSNVWTTLVNEIYLESFHQSTSNFIIDLILPTNFIIDLILPTNFIIDLILPTNFIIDLILPSGAW